MEQQPTRPRPPRTNGMVERIDGRIADVLKAHRFDSREDMQQTLPRYVARHNHQLPQSALGRKTPVQAMKDDWRQNLPHLLHKRPYPPPVRGAGMSAARRRRCSSACRAEGRPLPATLAATRAAPRTDDSGMKSDTAALRSSPKRNQAPKPPKPPDFKKTVGNAGRHALAAVNACARSASRSAGASRPMCSRTTAPRALQSVTLRAARMSVHATRLS